MTAVYDLFFSYSRRDLERVLPVVSALRTEGLKVWFDQSDVADFASITQSIREGLARTKALLAYYSVSYPRRHACQWELTAAFIAAQHGGAVQRRVLVINPEARVDHIHPIELRDANFLVAPATGDLVALQTLARKVRNHLQTIEDPLSDIHPLDKPRWFPNEGTRYRHFIGRTTELWRVHSNLHTRDISAIVGKGISGLAQITGLGGIGKSLLAEEYALRFGAAYPGGVFWLRAYGNDAAKHALSLAERETCRQDQIGDFAAKLGLNIKDRTPAEIEGDLADEIERRGVPCLWVVDDIPLGLDHESVRRWFAPHPLARTLITTRSQEYANVAEPLHLGALSQIEAFELLISRRTPETLQDEDAARGIVQDLGGHALAVDVAAAALKKAEGVFTFQQFRSELAHPNVDALAFATELAHELPNGHEKDIAGTLLHSLRHLGDEGWDLLRLASVLAVAPISPVFVGVVFVLADELIPDAAQHRALCAARDAEDLSLADMLEGGLRTVHPLVSRAVRFRDENPERAHQLRAAAVKIMVILLSGTSDDIRLHQGVELEVAHARELAKVLRDDADERLVLLLAQYDRTRGAYQSAALLLRQYLEYCQRTLGTEHPQTVSWTSALATMLEQAGDLAGARALHEKVLAIREPGLGTEHPETLTSLSNLASTLASQGNLTRALQLLEDVLRVQRRVFGSSHPDTLTSMNNVAEVLRRLGDFSRARKLHGEVLEVRRRTLGLEHIDTLTSMSNFGLLLRAAGELDRARALQKEALELRQRVLGLEHPDTVTSMSNLADVLGAQGHLKKARALQEEVLGVRRRVLPVEHPEVSVAAWNLLQTLRRLRDREASRALLENNLLWLLHQAPETLDWQQRQIRAWLSTTDIERVTGRRPAWWKRLFRGFVCVVVLVVYSAAILPSPLVSDVSISWGGGIVMSGK
jgi:tetratricopeptide (TPR) repeat protein